MVQCPAGCMLCIASEDLSILLAGEHAMTIVVLSIEGHSQQESQRVRVYYLCSYVVKYSHSRNIQNQIK